MQIQISINKHYKQLHICSLEGCFTDLLQFSYNFSNQLFWKLWSVISVLLFKRAFKTEIINNLLHIRGTRAADKSCWKIQQTGPKTTLTTAGGCLLLKDGYQLMHGQNIAVPYSINYFTWCRFEIVQCESYKNVCFLEVHPLTRPLICQWGVNRLYEHVPMSLDESIPICQNVDSSCWEFSAGK